MCRRTPDPTWTEFICKKKGEQENSSLAISVPTNMIIVWRVWDWIAQIQSYLLPSSIYYIVLKYLHSRKSWLATCTQLRKKHEMVYTQAKTARVWVEKKKIIHSKISWNHVSLNLRLIFGFSQFSASKVRLLRRTIEKKNLIENNWHAVLT